MRDWVEDWAQEGKLWIWQYADAKHGWRGWQLAVDPVGSRSIRNLLDRMSAGKVCHRTLRLESVSDALLRGIGYDRKCLRQFDKLKLQFVPEAEDLSLQPVEDKLVMTVGNRRLRKLASAFAEVEVGGGDFGITTSDNKRAESWMFWWPPRPQIK